MRSSLAPRVNSSPPVVAHPRAAVCSCGLIWPRYGSRSGHENPVSHRPDRRISALCAGPVRGGGAVVASGRWWLVLQVGEYRGHAAADLGFLDHTEFEE